MLLSVTSVFDLLQCCFCADPIQQLLERVRAQRQAWADYYHSRESAPVIPQTSSSETTTDEEGKRTGTEDHMDDSGKDHFM